MTDKYIKFLENLQKGLTKRKVPEEKQLGVAISLFEQHIIKMLEVLVEQGSSKEEILKLYPNLNLPSGRLVLKFFKDRNL